MNTNKTLLMITVLTLGGIAQLQAKHTTAKVFGATAGGMVVGNALSKVFAPKEKSIVVHSDVSDQYELRSLRSEVTKHQRAHRRLLTQLEKKDRMITKLEATIEKREATIETLKVQVKDLKNTTKKQRRRA